MDYGKDLENEVEFSLGIKQAKIMMSAAQANTVQDLIQKSHENVWCDEIASK